MFDRPMYYLLDEQGNPYPTEDRLAVGDLLTNVQKRRVSLDEREVAGHPIEVSTVFLVFDHQHLDGPPLLYETMVFIDGKEIGNATERYHTKEEAESGHQETVARVEQILMQLGSLNIDTSQIIGLLTSSESEKEPC